MQSILNIANLLVKKYHAIHHDVADKASFCLAQSLALYGLLRLTEMAIGIDQEGAVDKKIATLLLTGPDQPLVWPHERMGGLAGAYRFYQGAYKLGQVESSQLTLLTDQLCGVIDRLPYEQHQAETLLSVCPTLSMAAVVLQRPDLHDASIRLFEIIDQRLYEPQTGLFLHAIRADGSVLTGSFWGRANGAAAAALTEILRYLPYTHPARPALLARLHAFLDQLAALQTPNGLWRQILTDPSADEETSGSALIAYALFSACAQPAGAGIRWKETAQKAWDGLLGQIQVNGNGNIRGVCAGTPSGETLADYLEQPQSLNDLYGFGPLMLAAAAAIGLLRAQAWAQLPGSQYHFKAPSRTAVEAYFHQVHTTCEQNHNADGSYYQGTINDPDITFDEIIKESRTAHPIPRDTAHCILGYLDLYRVSPQPLYLERARAGLDWLVNEQEPDGCYRLWTRKQEGQVPHHGCLFETGIAGAALVKGYEQFHDKRYLAASERAARWAMKWPVDRNVNFNAFVIWHMAEHYRLTQNPTLLDSAIYKTRQAMMAPQQASGGWVGHNSWIWYHGINVRAYASLCQVLPEQHPFRPELEAALRASLGYFFQLQMANGAVHPNPDSLEKTSHLMFEIMVGVLLAWKCLKDPAIRESLDGLVSYRISPESGDPDRLFNNEKGYWLLGCSPWYVYALGSYLGQMLE